MPAQNLWSISCGLGSVGIAGVVYASVVGLSMGRLEGRYVPVLEDWMWHVVFPLIGYGLLIAAAALVWFCLVPGLYLIAALLLVLLFIGIHNAWDVAASISVGPTEAANKPEENVPTSGDG